MQDQPMHVDTSLRSKEAQGSVCASNHSRPRREPFLASSADSCSSHRRGQGFNGDRRESKRGVELRVTCEQPRLWPAFLRGQQEKQGTSQDRDSYDSNGTF